MRRSIFILLFIAVSLVSCNKLYNEINDDSKVLLQTKFIEIEETKAYASELGSGYLDYSKIAISLEDENGNVYDGHEEYKNVKVSANGRYISPSIKMYLSNTKGVLYSYYPYNESVTDITSIPVEITTQTDYMYGTPAMDLNNKNFTAPVNLNHALSIIRLRIYKGTYGFEGNITNITVKGENLASEAYLNIKNGELSQFSGINQSQQFVFNPFKITGNDVRLELFVLPTNEEKELFFTFTLDGKEWEIKTMPLQITPGNIVEYKVTFNSQNTNLDVPTVNAWGTESKENLTN